MKIDSGVSYLFASQHMNRAAGLDSQTSAFDTLLTNTLEHNERTAIAAADPVKIEHADFTNMTRNGLMEWVNQQIRTGEMSLDESSAFLGLSGKMPIDGRAGRFDSSERVNFFEIVRISVIPNSDSGVIRSPVSRSFS